MWKPRHLQIIFPGKQWVFHIHVSLPQAVYCILRFDTGLKKPILCCLILHQLSYLHVSASLHKLTHWWHTYIYIYHTHTHIYIYIYMCVYWYQVQICSHWNCYDVLNWGHKVWGMMQSSDSHNWLVVTSLVIYCRLFLVDNAQVVLFSKMMPFSEVFQRMRTERTMYHVLSCIIMSCSCWSY